MSQDRIEALAAALGEALDAGQRLADQIKVVADVPDSVDKSKPILGMNIRVPRHYLVDKIFNETYADPKELGQMIARGFTDGEERKLVEELRSLQDRILDPSVQTILDKINALADDAKHYVLLTPYGGLMDIHQWYSTEFRDALARVIHVETAMLDGEAILFDRRTTLVSSRKPEEKEGFTPIGETTIALGVFEDVHGGDEPQVRVETGEYFVVWPGDPRRIFCFGTESNDGLSVDAGE